MSTVRRSRRSVAPGPALAPDPLAHAAQPARPPVDGMVDPEILRLREATWRAWFAGDGGALADLLPGDFVGIGMSDGPFRDLEQTLADARAFRAGGGRLVSLEFPETRAQAFGDVVVLYGRFSVVLEADGEARTHAGRLTEIFARRDGRWWHPGWHLDLVPAS